MNTKKKHDGPIQKWGKRINWAKRVKAVCKPCWEIKYCPYGPLVEDFPLTLERDEKSCRIYGHDCPVFHVAEPFSETKELRNISREIPRPTQFRVLKRENQICSDCGKSVKDEEVEFDHIIPISKGGSSDESNIRLLCRECNRKKGKKFEDEYLIESFSELIIEPIGIDVISVLLQDVQLAHVVFVDLKRYPTDSDICRFYGRRKVRYEDQMSAKLILDFVEFFGTKKPKETKQSVFRALKYRWGFIDRQIHPLKESSRKFDITVNELLLAEISLIKRLGFRVNLTETLKKVWLRT